MYGENYRVELATIDDIDEIEKLYDDLNDYLEARINYAGWKKGIYPRRETAINGIKNEGLFVLRLGNKIVGSVVLDNNQDPAYSQINWKNNFSKKEIIVVHTLVVSPKYMKQGIGEKLLDFVWEYSSKLKMKAIRLDVASHNKPAISLYEKHGYKYKGTVDLELVNLDTVWFKVYELKLDSLGGIK